MPVAQQSRKDIQVKSQPEYELQDPKGFLRQWQGFGGQNPKEIPRSTIILHLWQPDRKSAAKARKRKHACVRMALATRVVRNAYPTSVDEMTSNGDGTVSVKVRFEVGEYEFSSADRFDHIQPPVIEVTHVSLGNGPCK